jgi:hypothetical protein
VCLTLLSFLFRFAFFSDSRCFLVCLTLVSCLFHFAYFVCFILLSLPVSLCFLCLCHFAFFLSFSLMI